MLRRLCYVAHAQTYARQSQRWCHGLSHVSKDGASPRMVDVGSKQVTRRTARAQAIVHLPTHVSEALLPPSHTKGDAVRELVGPKGPIFTTATIAGVMAAKRTSELIPFCHPLPLDSCNIDIELKGNEVVIESSVKVTHKTGVEMEALTAAYDMCKALSHDIVINSTQLVEKTGGKRDVNKQA